MFGAYGKEMSSWFEPKGIMVPAYFLNGPKHVTSRVLIRGPEDMKGIKLRTQQAATMIEFGKSAWLCGGPHAVWRDIYCSSTWYRRC